MGQLIKTFTDGTYIEYDRGQFDDWCVFYMDKNGERKPPRDIDYFKTLKSHLGKIHGARKVYEDFVKVYNWTGKTLDQNVLDDITELSCAYGPEALCFNKVMSIIYCGMIAEEQKEGTHLGKRIKRLGVHVLLCEGVAIEEAANFMRRMRWQDIDKRCQTRGF